MRPRWMLVLVLAALLGCGRGNPPRWLSLAVGFEPELASIEGAWARPWPLPFSPDSAELDAAFVEREGSLWLRTGFGSEAWRKAPLPGHWTLPYPATRGPGRAPDGVPRERLILLVDGVERELERGTARRADGIGLDPGTFTTGALGRIGVCLEGNEPPPGGTFLRAVSLGERVAADGSWRVVGNRFSGLGFPLWPGMRYVREVTLPPGASLRVATTVDNAVAVTADASAPPPVRFRILLDGIPLLDAEQTSGVHGGCVWRSIDLPRGGVRQARLEFEVLSKGFAYTAFLAPAIVPARVGTAAARPWGDTRPDIVVFLADTFRADNMTSYGGTLGLTQHLDAFARRARFFPRTWSVGTFTLPTHSTMFTGLFPRQCAADDMARALPSELETIAEFLRARGYRTGAVTDSVVVSQRYGLDQGFEWFDESRQDLDATLARTREFLDADDGRPVFLWVQTYRVHRPYHVSPATIASHGARLGLDGTEDADALDRELAALSEHGAVQGVAGDEARALVAAIERIYRGGAVDLDRGFGTFLADLETRSWFENGYLVFTSDHGEAFYEHDELYHSGSVYEEQVRVPLLIGGRGLDPVRIPFAASLVDLPPTFAQMAGFASPAEFLGTSLLTLDRERPVFAFECASAPRPSTVAMVEGTHKLLALESAFAGTGGAPLSAFDLADDPVEQHDRIDVAWRNELWLRLFPSVRGLMIPRVGADAARIGTAERAELEALGYAGTEDDE